MRSWTMRKATKRLRGSFSPSITWMKPNVKSAPRPFSSGKERTRSLLSHGIESLYSLAVSCFPFWPSREALFVFLFQVLSEDMYMCKSVCACVCILPTLGEDWPHPSLYHSSESWPFYTSPRTTIYPSNVGQIATACSSYSSQSPASYLLPVIAWS